MRAPSLLLSGFAALLSAAFISTTAFALKSLPPDKNPSPQTETQTETAQPNSQQQNKKTDAADTPGAPYPGTVKQAFLRSCINNHEELINSCKCMILTFERMVPLNDFNAIAAADDPTQDARFLKVTSACLRAQRQSQQ